MKSELIVSSYTLVDLVYHSSTGKAYELFLSFSQFQILNIYQDRMSCQFYELVDILKSSRKETYKQLKVQQFLKYLY